MPQLALSAQRPCARGAGANSSFPGQGRGRGGGVGKALKSTFASSWNLTFLLSSQNCLLLAVKLFFRLIQSNLLLGIRLDFREFCFCFWAA